MEEIVNLFHGFAVVVQPFNLLLMVIGILMIGLGFAMIVMPAPPYFEMFTIYYFSADDGVTLMDIISLIIILAGVYLVIRSINRKNFIQANK